MRTVCKLGVNLIVLLLLSSVAILFVQAQAKVGPTFALAIEVKPLEAENTPGTLILLVKYTNISDVIQKDGCAISSVAYEVVVLRDGLSAEKRKLRGENTGKSPDPRSIKRPLIMEQDTCHGIDKGIKPGESIKFTVWVSSEYDMTVPGTYEITVTRETDRWNPDRSVTVRSNTLTIVVPEPGADAPK